MKHTSPLFLSSPTPTRIDAPIFQKIKMDDERDTCQRKTHLQMLSLHPADASFISLLGPGEDQCPKSGSHQTSDWIYSCSWLSEPLPWLWMLLTTQLAFLCRTSPRNSFLGQQSFGCCLHVLLPLLLSAWSTSIRELEMGPVASPRCSPFGNSPLERQTWALILDA